MNFWDHLDLTNIGSLLTYIPSEPMIFSTGIFFFLFVLFLLPYMAIKNTHLRIIYVALFPCNECSKAIIQSGIKEIVYLSDKYDGTDTNRASKKMLDSAGVKYRQFTPNMDKLEIDFKNI